MKAIRLWRLRRAYRTIARLEVKLLGSSEVAELRKTFTSQSYKIIQRYQRRVGMKRPERRRFQREMVNAIGK